MVAPLGFALRLVNPVVGLLTVLAAFVLGIALQMQRDEKEDRQ